MIREIVFIILLFTLSAEAQVLDNGTARKLSDFDIKFYSSEETHPYCWDGDGGDNSKKDEIRHDYDDDPSWARFLKFSTIFTPPVAFGLGGYENNGTIMYIYSESTAGKNEENARLNLIWRWNINTQKIELGFHGRSFTKDGTTISDSRSYTHYFESTDVDNKFNSELILARNALVAIINSNGVMIKRKDFVSHEKNIFGNYADVKTHIKKKGTHDGNCFTLFEESSILTVEITDIYVDGDFTNWYDGTCNKLIFDSYFYDDEDITIKASETITMSLVESDGNKPVEVQDGSRLELKAGEKIVLKPGFHAKAGSYFRASIDNTIECESFKFEDKNGLVVNNEDELMQIEEESFNSENGLSAKSFTNSSSLIKVYPNPTHGELTVTLPEGTYNLQLTDITGKLVADFGNNTQATQTLNVSHLDNGMYFLKIYNHETQHIERVVVQK